MRTGKAAVFTGVEQPFSVQEYAVASPSAGMALLELVASGICGTDIHIHRGKIPLGAPLIIGHEFIGRVLEISPEDAEEQDIHTGDAVIASVASPCGECLLCKDGDDANCLHMGVTYVQDPAVPPHFFGGYGEYNYSPAANLVKIPPALDPKMACVFPCAGPTALHAFALAEKAGVDLKKIHTAVVQGLGPVGTFAVLYLAALGIPNIIAVTGRHNEKRAVLAQRLGATEILNMETMGEDGVAARIAEISGGIGADLAFEASGNPAAFAQGLSYLRNRGVFLVPGQYSNSGPVPVEPQVITFKALHIIGSSQYSLSDVRRYVDFLQKNPRLHETIWELASCYTVDQINQAFVDAKGGKNIKTMLVKG